MKQSGKHRAESGILVPCTCRSLKNASFRIRYSSSGAPGEPAERATRPNETIRVNLFSSERRVSVAIVLLNITVIVSPEGSPEGECSLEIVMKGQEKKMRWYIALIVRDDVVDIYNEY